MTEKILVRSGSDWLGMIRVGAVWCVTKSGGDLTEDREDREGSAKSQIFNFFPLSGLEACPSMNKHEQA
jgi:hypothetical protein